jgi:hypothetical protein
MRLHPLTRIIGRITGPQILPLLMDGQHGVSTGIILVACQPASPYECGKFHVVATNHT